MVGWVFGGVKVLVKPKVRRTETSLRFQCGAQALSNLTVSYCLLSHGYYILRGVR